MIHKTAFPIDVVLKAVAEVSVSSRKVCGVPSSVFQCLFIRVIFWSTVCRESPCLSVGRWGKWITALSHTAPAAKRSLWKVQTWPVPQQCGDTGVVWAAVPLSHSQTKTAWPPDHSYTCTAWWSRGPQSTPLANMHVSQSCNASTGPKDRKKTGATEQ